MKPALMFAVVLALVLPARAQVYKWTDADGRVHYGGAPPAADQPAQTLDIQSQPTPDGEVDNVGAMRRATRELRELRAVNRGVSVRELDRPRSSRRKKNTPTHIGYEDQAKIDNLNSDIRRLSSSTLGSARSHSREIRAAKSELRQIYRKYGIKPP
ncbi:MAG: DUF4124 domain-containing protein [Candidatus Competibacter sp.]|nr:DUF4124 domain-containing protein [Candidatus Competibacter sp.]MDG4585147.1 DUF4124 domain-containing protein [Candidatus Competibacter sp.]